MIRFFRTHLFVSECLIVVLFLLLFLLLLVVCDLEVRGVCDNLVEHLPFSRLSTHYFRRGGAGQ